MSNDKKRILLVDDSHDILKAFSKLLTHFGYEVACAGDGLSAINMAVAFRPDVALIDIRLPDMSGYEVAKQLKEQNARHEYKTVLIAVTGFRQEEVQLQARPELFDHYAVKPIGIEEFKKLVSDASSKKI